MTSPFFTSVTYTGLTVVVVVIVAFPFIPGLSSWTGTCLSPTVKRKSAGTVYSRVPSASFTTTTLPSTETISNDFTCVVVDWAWAAPAARARAAARAGSATLHGSEHACSFDPSLTDRCAPPGGVIRRRPGSSRESAAHLGAIPVTTRPW